MLFEKCKEICDILTHNVQDVGADKLLYENQHNGYYIFGLDVLVKPDLTPILIKCNETPGFDTLTLSANARLSKMIYKWVNSTVLEPLFGKKSTNQHYA